MIRRFRTGLVVGKFCPLHRGHELVIGRAARDCDAVVVLSYSRPELPRCGTARRRAWLASLFPAVHAIVLEAEEAPPNEAPGEVHRRFVAGVLAARGRRIDAVFSSEDYGEPLAHELQRAQGAPVSHVMVDRERAAVPVSGTRLRMGGPYTGFLSPVVAADLVFRVAMLGGESSGKTTLAAAVAQRLAEPWVAEYGRERWVEARGRLEFDDLAAIAHQQVRREEEASLRARHTLLCDTTPLTTRFYSEEMFGRVDPGLEQLSRRRYDLAVLCAPDFTFEQDGTRRDASFRARAHEWYRVALGEGDAPWFIAEGSLEARIGKVLEQLEGPGT